MLRDPNILALSRCGREVVAATNGHGRRWAAERCVRALVEQGTPLVIAANTAQAMVAVLTSGAGPGSLLKRTHRAPGLA